MKPRVLLEKQLVRQLGPRVPRFVEPPARPAPQRQQHLDAEAEQRVAEAEQHRAEAEQRVAEAEQHRAEAEQHRAEAEQRLAEVEQRLAETQQRLAETQQRLAETQQRLAETQQRLAEAEQGLALMADGARSYAFQDQPRVLGAEAVKMLSTAVEDLARKLPQQRVGVPVIELSVGRLRAVAPKSLPAEIRSLVLSRWAKGTSVFVLNLSVGGEPRRARIMTTCEVEVDS